MLRVWYESDSLEDGMTQLMRKDKDVQCSSKVTVQRRWCSCFLRYA